MPTFDIVSEVDMHEMSNAVDQASREIGTRFDFKGVPASFELNDNVVVLTAEVDFQIQQMMEILKAKLVKRGVDIKSMEEGDIVETGKKATMKVVIKQGIEADMARKIVKMIKDKKMKVQTAIQGEKLRVTGKKRDDLQSVMAVLKEDNWGLPLQFNNFRD